MPDVPLGWSASDDDSVVRCELSDGASRPRPREPRPAGWHRRRIAWLLAACAAALVITGLLGFTGGDADGVEGTRAILEPLPPDADTSSIDALTRDVLTLGRNL